MSDPDLLLLLEDLTVGFASARPHYVVSCDARSSYISKIRRENLNMKNIRYSSANNHEELAHGVENLVELVGERRQQLAYYSIW